MSKLKPSLEACAAAKKISIDWAIYDSCEHDIALAFDAHTKDLQNTIARLTREIAEARDAEAADIVAWLRSLDAESGDINRFLPSTLANWIEEGMDNL